MVGGSFIDNLMSNVIASLALALSVVTIIRTEYVNFKNEQKARIPKIEILKIVFPKSMPDMEADWTTRHSRHFFGKQKRDISCGGMIKTMDMELSETKEFIEQHGEIYFTDFKNTPCVMMNFLNDIDNFIVDHQSTIIVFKNNGDILKGISLKSMDIVYYSNKGTVHLNGNPEEFKTFDVERGRTFKIILDEATNDFHNSVCELNTDVYKNAPDGMNILDKKFDVFFLKYESLTLNCIVMNSDNEKFELRISLSLNKKYLIPKTEIVKIIKAKKI